MTQEITTIILNFEVASAKIYFIRNTWIFWYTRISLNAYLEEVEEFRSASSTTGCRSLHQEKSQPLYPRIRRRTRYTSSGVLWLELRSQFWRRISSQNIPSLLPRTNPALLLAFQFANRIHTGIRRGFFPCSSICRPLRSWQQLPNSPHAERRMEDWQWTCPGTIQRVALCCNVMLKYAFVWSDTRCVWE